MKIRLFILLTFFPFCLSASAQQTLKGSIGIAGPPAQESQMLLMAGKLVSYGRQTKSALPLIQAVQIFKSLNVTDDKVATSGDNPFSEAQLLSEATKYADGNKTLLQLIKETEKETRGGPFEAPLRYYRSIEPDETIYQSLHVKGSSYVQIVVDGQGEGNFKRDENGNLLSSDLRLFVYDSKGRIVASDDSIGKDCVANFVSTSSNMTIAITNVGKLSDTCVIYVNKSKILNY